MVENVVDSCPVLPASRNGNTERPIHGGEI